MNAKSILEALRLLAERRRPTTRVALIAAAAWVATVALIGKWALVILFPAFLIALCKVC